jgi:hypothetical protein
VVDLNNGNNHVDDDHSRDNRSGPQGDLYPNGSGLDGINTVGAQRAVLSADRQWSAAKHDRQQKEWSKKR